MYTIPINVLYNIFYSNERKLNNYENAYKFINKTLINESDVDSQYQKNDSLLVLLESLEITKLTKECIKDSFLQRSNHHGFNPFLSNAFIEQNSEKLQKYEDTLNEIKKVIVEKEKLVEKIANYEQTINEINESCKKELQQKEQIINEMKESHIKELQQKDQIINEMKEVQIKDLQQLTTTINQMNAIQQNTTHQLKNKSTLME